MTNVVNMFLVTLMALMLLPSHAFASSCLKADAKGLLKKSQAYDGIILKASKKYAIEANLIRSVIAIESCFNRNAVSPAGAEGLMQLMPATADRFGVKNSFNTAQNINAGTRYLKFLQQRYNNDLRKVLAAYNAGEGKVDRYQGVPPYKETQKYITDVAKTYRKLSPRKLGLELVANPKGGKPGRQGTEELRERAPHLFKKTEKWQG